MLGPLERYMTPKLDAALLYSSRAGTDLGGASDWFEELTYTYDTCLWVAGSLWSPEHSLN